MRPPSPQLRTAALVVFFAALGPAQSAWAALGGPRESVEADRAHLAATLTSSSAATHTVHALTMANGGVAREYARSDGVVFAVSWNGPARPDLRQLLGSYFDTFQADNALRAGRRTRLPLAVNRSDFVVHGGGHSGAFWGRALLPRLAPAGFSARDWR